jgi:membrane-bound lytic murein transglycosylase D
VRSGESLSVIASKYGTSVDKLMDWNNLRSTRLKIGQKINIYGGTASAPVKKPSSTVSESIPKDGGHVIQRGESLWKIAQKYGTTVDDLLKMNPGVDPNDLKVGQKSG